MQPILTMTVACSVAVRAAFAPKVSRPSVVRASTAHVSGGLRVPRYSRMSPLYTEGNTGQFVRSRVGGQGTAPDYLRRALHQQSCP